MENKWSNILVGFIILWITYTICNTISNHINISKKHYYDTEASLRKISTQLEKCIPYDENWEYNHIKERYEEAEIIISAELKQIKCYDSGKMRRGFIANLIPESWLNPEEQAFDLCNKEILDYYANKKHCLTEHMELIKKTLLDRSMGNWARDHAEFTIQLRFSAIIEKEIARYLIEKNEFKKLDNLHFLIRKYYKHSRDDDKVKTIVDQIIKLNLSVRSKYVKDLIKKAFIDSTIVN